MMVEMQPPIRAPEPWRPYTSELYPTGIQYDFHRRFADEDLGDDRFAFLFGDATAQLIAGEWERSRHLRMYIQLAAVTTDVIFKAMRR
jgi:hypothetical protein